MMRYLVVKDGKIMMFHVRSCAEIYAKGSEIKELMINEDGTYVERF